MVLRAALRWGCCLGVAFGGLLGVASLMGFRSWVMILLGVLSDAF